MKVPTSPGKALRTAILDHRVASSPEAALQHHQTIFVPDGSLVTKEHTRTVKIDGSVGIEGRRI